MEVSGEILKRKYHTLQDAIKAADEINKEGIKYDSVKLGEKHFQLRKADFADKFDNRSLWLLKSEKERILAKIKTKIKKKDNQGKKRSAGSKEEYT